MRMSLSAAAAVILAVGICSGASAKAPLRGTIVDNGNGNGASLPAGNDTIDSVTVDCSSRLGCELMVPIMVELGSGNGQWKICPTVDGVAMAPPCQVQGVVAGGSAKTYTGMAWSNATLTQGKHDVAAVLSINHASTLDAWQATYIFWPLRP